MKYLLIIIILVTSIYTQAQSYEGTIGKHPVFLELDLDYDDNSAFAFYFYQSHLQNISFSGDYNAPELILYEKNSEDAEEELFTLSLNRNKLTGTWQKNNQTLPVDLTKTTNSLADYKLKNLEFVRDSITTYNTKELVWFTEKYSQKSLFRLGNGFTKQEREFVNAKLDSLHAQQATIGLECSWADFAIDIELVSNEYISFTEYASIYCGGAHPSHNTGGYNFDLKNKLQLDKLTDIYPNLKLYQLLEKKYENDSELDSECGYFTDSKEVWEYYSWVFTKSGISITPSFPHAMTPCEVGFPITYKELEANH